MQLACKGIFEYQTDKNNRKKERQTNETNKTTICCKPNCKVFKLQG